MTIERLWSQSLISLGLSPSDFSEAEKTVHIEQLNQIVNDAIMKTKPGVTDLVVQLATGQRYYHLDGKVHSVESAILNDQIPITDCQVPISQLLAG